MKYLITNSQVDIHSITGPKWIRHGKGLQTWPDGSNYNGSWHEDIMTGHGIKMNSCEDIYEGEFSNGKANG